MDVLGLDEEEDCPYTGSSRGRQFWKQQKQLEADLEACRQRTELDRVLKLAKTMEFEKQRIDGAKNGIPKFVFEPLEHGSHQEFISGQNAGMMRLANSVYNTEGAPKGFRRLGLDEIEKTFQIDPLSFVHDTEGNYGFYSALYTDDNGTYFYVLRGTDMTDTFDWYANFMQNFGLGKYSESYNQAIDVGRSISEVIKKKNLQLHIVGHSLGGGLASAVALATNSTCTTINSAGLNYMTMGNRESQFKLINSIYIKGEILSWAQEGSNGTSILMCNAIGNRVSITPPDKPISNSVFNNPINKIKWLKQKAEWHKMSSVEKTFK